MPKRKLSLAGLAALAALLCAASACAGGNAPAVSGEAGDGARDAVSVTDMMGRAFSLDAPASRIVALTAAECELVYAVGAEGALVGRGAFCDYPPEALALPAVQSGKETNVEQVIALAPQLVLTSDMEQSHGQLDQLEQSGVRVAICDAHTIEQVYEALALTGRLTGREAEAQAVIDNMKSVFSAISARAAGKGGKTVYFEVSPLEYGLWTAGSGTFMNEIASLLGLENCFADLEGWAEVSEEQVIARNPDYIVTVTMYGGEALTPRAEILARPGWQALNAVKTGSVLHVENNELTRPGPRLADGALLLCDFVFGPMRTAK